MIYSATIISLRVHLPLVEANCEIKAFKNFDRKYVHQDSFRVTLAKENGVAASRKMSTKQALFEKVVNEKKRKEKWV